MSRRPRLRQAVHVGALLEQVLKSSGLDERLQQARAMIVWDDVVGLQISTHTKPAKIRDDVLEVCVDHPTWMQQLQLMKPQILRKLNAELGDTPLRDIFLKRGKVIKSPEGKGYQKLPWKTVAVRPEEKQLVSALLTGIEDSELRKKLEALLLKQLQLNKVSHR